MVKSHGVVFPRVGEVAIEEIEVPSPGTGEVLVESNYSVISPGTERARLLNLRGEIKYPFRPGYSTSGHITALGPDVDNLRVGDRVVVNSPHAAHVTVAASRVIPVPEGCDLESAAFYRLGHVALHGARRAGIEIGESVAVIGQGLLGLVTLQMAKLQGGLPVLALDVEQRRLERSAAFGADLVASPTDREEMMNVLADLGGGPTIAIEVTGYVEPINLAVEIVRRMGRIVLLGSEQHRGAIPADVFLAIHRKGISVVGAQTSGRPLVDSRPGAWTWQDDARTFLDLVRWNRLEVNSLITHRVAGREAPGLFEKLKRYDPDLIGGLLEWQA